MPTRKNSPPPTTTTKTAAKKTATKKTAKKPLSTHSTLVLAGLPVLWANNVGSGQAIGIHVDDQEVWGGWESGDVVVCDHAGGVQRRWKLPSGVDALVADEVWRYAGCHDGKVYDLTGRAPRVAYELENHARIHWLDVYRGNLCVADDGGSLTVIDVDGQRLFRHEPKKAQRGWSGWMVRADASGVYLGNDDGVSKFDWAGEPVWSRKTGHVGFGCQQDQQVYALVRCSSYARNDSGKNVAVVGLSKDKGKALSSASCWSDQPSYRNPNTASSCAATADGRFFGASHDTIFAFDKDGVRLWEAFIGEIGGACSMAYQQEPGGEERLFVVTHKGNLACLDISADTIASAAQGQRALNVQTLASIDRSTRAVDDTGDSSVGVVVECVSEGGQLRVRVISPGYHTDWYCQFPRDIREEGARYVVDEVREAGASSRHPQGFYRVRGDIRRLRS